MSDYPADTSTKTGAATPSNAEVVAKSTNFDRSVSRQTVTPERHDPAQVVVAETTINYDARGGYRTSREESATIRSRKSSSPLTAGSAGVRFRLLGVESLDGQDCRSDYAYPPDNGCLALDRPGLPDPHDEDGQRLHRGGSYR